MIKIYMRSKEREIEFVKWIGGEVSGRVFVNFPIKGITRKDRRTGLYKVVNAPARFDKPI